MRISNIKIENYRSIIFLDVGLTQICALIGPNNAGKSNILHAIQQVLGRDWLSVNSFDEDDVYGKDPDKDILIEITIDPSYQYHKYKDATPVEIGKLVFKYTRYKKGQNAGQRRLEQKCLDAKGKDALVPTSAPKKGEQLKYEPLIGIPSDVKENIPLIFIDTNRALKDQLPSARYSLLRQLLEDVNRDFCNDVNKIDVRNLESGDVESNSRSERFKALMSEAISILRTDKFIGLEKSIKDNALRQLGFDPKKDSDKLNLYFSPFSAMEFYKSLNLLVKENGFAISATELGGGIQNAIVVAILQAYEERLKSGAIFLIEEPEMYLHPQMQRSLNNTLQIIGQKNQLIYTTHSAHFISVPDYKNIALVRKISGQGTTLKRSSLISNGKIKEKLNKEFDSQRNEMFFATKLLLVEGDTERLSFPEWAKKTSIDLERLGATIVEVSGKRNLMLFADIAKSFGIPTGIVYDEDSSDFDNKRQEEKEYNKTLNSYDKKDGVKTWCLSKKYEDIVKATVGDKKYQELCQKYPDVSNPVRARLIAADIDASVPDQFQEILKWLSGMSSD